MGKPKNMSHKMKHNELQNSLHPEGLNTAIRDWKNTRLDKAYMPQLIASISLVPPPPSYLGYI